jgi:hypothetical protein
LISGGSNQEISNDTIVDSTTYDTASDDIVEPINVNQEATEIALDEVRELQRRVNQFDNLFTGADSCAPASDLSHSDCKPGTTDSSGDTWSLDGVNCGTGSLDQIQDDSDSYGCFSSDLSGRGSDFITDALHFIIAYYALGDNYLLDPWGNPYQWGCSDTICTTAPNYTPPDPQYRKFFSMGPDGEAGTGDDIIP